jgi:hypothetical protein
MLVLCVKLHSYKDSSVLPTVALIRRPLKAKVGLNGRLLFSKDLWCRKEIPSEQLRWPFATDCAG